MNSDYEPPIFVVGLPRSGSTLLELALSKSPGVLRLAEALYLSPWKRDFRYFLRSRVGSLSKEENLRSMVEIILSEHGEIPGICGIFWRFREARAIGEELLKQKLFARLKTSDRSLGTVFSVLLEEITRFNGCRRCCAPFPVHVSCLPELVRWFPEAKIVHITRDPRAIAISKTNDPGGTALYNQRWPHLRYFIRKAMLAFVVVQYISASRQHRRFERYSNYLLVKYEDLVLHQANELQRICEFAGIQFTEDMLEQCEERAQRSSITGELRTRTDARAAAKWMEVITGFERFFVTASCRRSMARFGFDPDSHPIYEPVRMKGREAQAGLLLV